MKRLWLPIVACILVAASARAQTPFGFSGVSTGPSPTPGAGPLSASALDQAGAGKVDTVGGVLTSPSVAGGLSATESGQTIVRLKLFPVSVTFGDAYTSPDSLQLGGVDGNQTGGGSLTLRGQPYGYYDTGTLFSLVNTGLPLTSSRAGVNGGFEAGVPAMADYAGLDMVNEYNQVGNIAPWLTLTGVTYDATHIYPPVGTTFSALQLLQLRRSMWVVTNSVNPSVSSAPAARYGATPYPPGQAAPSPVVYASTVISWSPASIVVSGWTVPGSGITTAGQVPAAASTQIAYFGSPFKQFARNTAMYHLPGISGSLTNQFEGEELDMTDLGTTDYGATYHGYTVHYTPSGVVPAQGGVAAHNVLPASDSYGVNISGPLPVMLQLQGGPQTSWDIDADSLRLLMPASPLPAAGSLSLLSDYRMYVDTNVAHLLTWMSRDTATVGPTSASMHLGLRYDSSFGLIGDGAGTPMAQFVWNPPGYYGGLAVENAAGQFALTVDNSGNADVSGEVISASNIVAGNGASYIMRTTAGTQGAALSTDSLGNLVVGSQISGGGGIRLLSATGPIVMTGTGVPTMVAPNGSEYLRSDGTTGARVYFSTGSGWLAVPGV